MYFVNIHIQNSLTKYGFSGCQRRGVRREEQLEEKKEGKRRREKSDGHPDGGDHKAEWE